MKLLLIDGNSLINRAFYAMPLLSTAKGEYTNAVLGFLNMFYKMLDESTPTHILVAFDLKAPTFRHTQFANYKAGRKSMPEELVPQVTLLKNVLTEMGVAIAELEGYEADDIIGTFARLCHETGSECVILTGDKDALQLITDFTTVWLTKKGISETVRYTPQMLFEDYKLTPDQIRDLKGLMGDSSDNIPGVSGVGEKTALKLLEEYHTVENLYENVEKISGKLGERLTNEKESAFFSKQLATIDTRIPIQMTLEDCAYTPKDAQTLREIFTRLEFKSLLNKLNATTQPEEAKPSIEIHRTECTDTSDIAKVLQENQAAKQVAVTITQSEISFAFSPEAEYCIPLAVDLLSGGLQYQEAFASVIPLLKNDGITKILFDAKAILHEAVKMGTEVSKISDDIMLAEYLLDAVKTDFSLKRIAEKYNTTLTAAGILQICADQRGQMEQKGILPLYTELEMPLIEVLFDMEQAGFCVDKGILQELGAEFSAKLESLKNEIYALSGNDSFNINSTKQLGEVLFEQLGLPKSKKTKTGYSTDNEVLEALSEQHPIIPMIIEYRQAQKFKSTYIDGLMGLIDQTGRIHSTFNQVVASTGRISSTEPNLQNIPIRTDYGRNIRKAFIAKDSDYVLVDADYSQIELRILAHLSDDPTLIDSFRKGEDIHTRTAAEVFEIPLGEVTATQRSAAKAVNFGIVYGISDFGLAQNISVSRKKAGEYIERYFNRYGKVKAFMDACVSQAKAQGYVTSMLGRRRDIPELKSTNYNIRSFGERVAMNTPVQGSAADVIKLAMLHVFQELKKEGVRARLILQVHDELIIEAHKEDAQITAEILTETMENVMQLKVPLLVEAKTGHSWYETK